MHEPRNEETRFAFRLRLALLGPVLFGLVLAWRPPGLDPAGGRTLAVAAWMAAWWLTGAVPLPVTALLPLPLFPWLGVASPAQAAVPYANPVIFLFMGGLFLAAAIERWGLHRRIALGVLARTGTSPRRVVAGFMGVTAFLSMWISNTATAALAMPIALAVLRLAGERPGQSAWGAALMLGVAYAASIGGVATLIGTPPNAIFAANAQELGGRSVGFAEWFTFAAPVAAVLLAFAWWVLCVARYRLPRRAPEELGAALAAARDRLGPWTPAERRTALVFAATALAWLAREPKTIAGWTVPGLQSLWPRVDDATIAMAAAAALFLTPAGRGARTGNTLLDWETAQRIPWGVLLLFGGGLSLATQFEATGCTTWFAERLGALRGWPAVALTGAVATTFLLVTEVASNTATAALAMPVVAALGQATGADPLPLMAAVAVASSLAFMLPVGTPPNAIVYATGYVSASEMASAGWRLNLASAVGVTLAMHTWFRWVVA